MVHADRILLEESLIRLDRTDMLLLPCFPFSRTKNWIVVALALFFALHGRIQSPDQADHRRILRAFCFSFCLAAYTLTSLGICCTGLASGGFSFGLLCPLKISVNVDCPTIILVEHH